MVRILNTRLRDKDPFADTLDSDIRHGKPVPGSRKQHRNHCLMFASSTSTPQASLPENIQHNKGIEWPILQLRGQIQERIRSAKCLDTLKSQCPSRMAK